TPFLLENFPLVQIEKMRQCFCSVITPRFLFELHFMLQRRSEVAPTRVYKLRTAKTAGAAPCWGQPASQADKRGPGVRSGTYDRPALLRVSATAKTGWCFFCDENFRQGV